MRIIIPLICIFILSFHYLHASDINDEKLISKEWKIGGMVHVGRYLIHSPMLAPIIERNALGGEIFLSKQTYGKHHWNSFFNYPEYGISYTYMDIGSLNYLGMAHCLLPYFNFRFFNNRNIFNVEFHLGIGGAYVEKVYDAQKNPDNHAVSTHFNGALNGKLNVSLKISKNWSLFVGTGLLHLSNGAYEKPNKGVNILSFFSGISHSFGRENTFISQSNKINEKNKNWDCSVYLMGGIKEINPIGGSKYLVGDFNLEVTKKHLQYTRFGLSLDITHDKSDYDNIIFQSMPAVERIKTTRLGVSGGYEILFGELSLDLFLGTYIYEPNLHGRIYQRTSLRYPISDRAKVSLSLRNHKGKADFIGLGLGFRLF